MHGRDNTKFKIVLSQSLSQSCAITGCFCLGLMCFSEFLLESRSLKNCFIQVIKNKI